MPPKTFARSQMQLCRSGLLAGGPSVQTIPKPSCRRNCLKGGFFVQNKHLILLIPSGGACLQTTERFASCFIQRPILATRPFGSEVGNILAKSRSQMQASVQIAGVYGTCLQSYPQAIICLEVFSSKKSRNTPHSASSISRGRSLSN